MGIPDSIFSENALSGAAVALRRAGFELTMMPERFRAYLDHPDDYFMEASIAGSEDHESIRAIMKQINAIVDRYRDYCWECGPILSDHVRFEGLFDRAEKESAMKKAAASPPHPKAFEH